MGVQTGIMGRGRVGQEERERRAGIQVGKEGQKEGIKTGRTDEETRNTGDSKVSQ